MIESFPSSVVEALADHYRADEIWLFGSRARGEARMDSDWDVLVLMTGEADKGRHSSAPGNEIIEKTGMKGDVFHMHSDVFHASMDVPNSLARIAGEDRILLHRREGYVPAPMTAADAQARFMDNLKSEAADYLAAAELLRGKRYGRLNLLRFATRNILVAMLTKAGDHVGSDAYRVGGKMVMFDRIPEKHRCDHLRDGIILLGKLNSFDLAETQECVPQPTSEDDAVLDRLHAAIEFLLKECL